MPYFNWDKIITLFGIIIVILFIVLGILVIFSDMFYYIPKSYRIIIGVLLMLYGAYRLALLYNKFINKE